MDYVVKMDGEKVRMFNGVDYDKVEEWANLHCRSGKVRIVSISDCGRLPKASSRVRPNLNMPDLVYKPFVSLS